MIQSKKKGFFFSLSPCKSALTVILLSLSPKEAGSGPHSITKLLLGHFVHVQIWNDSENQFVSGNLGGKKWQKLVLKKCLQEECSL